MSFRARPAMWLGARSACRKSSSATSTESRHDQVSAWVSLPLVRPTAMWCPGGFGCRHCAKSGEHVPKVMVDRDRGAAAGPLAWQEGECVRQVLGESATPVTRLVELPGRGTTRVWECAGPRGAQTLMLIHGVTFTAELNWGKVFAPLARHFRVVAADLRGHGDGIRAGSRFRLEDCADDVATLAGVLGLGRVTAGGYSMGGMVAQRWSRRHAPLVCGRALCATLCD